MTTEPKSSMIRAEYKHTMKTVSNYRTENTREAAYLFAAGVRHISTDWDDPQHVAFLFDQPAPELLSAWQSHTAIVNAQAVLKAYSDFIASTRRRGRD